MPVLGWLLSALVGGFSVSLVQGIVKALISVGIGFVVYQGVDVLLASVTNQIASNLNSLDPQILAVLALMKVDKAINVIISAYGVRLLLKGLTGGSITKMVVK